eukprot:CAMPEP_0181386586 /NCGR_PEP_ID=MMETSP1106-20121128/23225_1 /TAXON_ID=81844 /ORGANISM="Mantoniella antarctica, Strain SL-175" /LENGTH=146 /DNA_ID=CAMNT_0023506829 /DNA_START=58 /DNA_END=494 /DNA_ORIENTATION=-
MSDSDTAPLLGKLRPKSTIGKGVSFFVAAATIASLVGALFFARGGSKLLTRADHSLGVEASQPFVNAAGVQQGQCDLVTCDLADEGPSIGHEPYMYSFVDDCRGGGAGCVGEIEGCRHCLVGEVTREHHPGFPVCPPCVCEQYGRP